jgi:hypothetical protein
VVRVAVVVAMVLGVSPMRAGATTEGSGELRGGRLFVGVEATSGGQVAQIDARSSSLPPLVHYRSTPLPGGRAGTLGNICNAATPPDVLFGWLYDVVGYTSDGRMVSDTPVCVPFPDQANRSVPPAPLLGLPPTPTVGDVWRAVTLPAPVVGVNPVSRGVTGLDSWLWSGGPQTAQIAVTLGGFRVTGVARLVEYRFFTDEGYLGASATPGDAASPAAKHRFATKGAHLLGVSSVWRARVTIVGAGGAAPVPLDIDSAVLTATVDYPVTEVRSRLVS